MLSREEKKPMGKSTDGIPSKCILFMTSLNKHGTINRINLTILLKKRNGH